MQQSNDSMPEIHPAAALFPMMNDEEIAALADDIKENGQTHPVTFFGGRLLDGRNRWRACQLAGVEPKQTVFSGKSATAFVISANLKRRHLTPAQKAQVAVSALPHYADEAAERQREALKRGNTTKHAPSASHDSLLTEKQNNSKRAVQQAAKATGAGIESTHNLKAIKERTPEVFDRVRQGSIATVADAKKVAALPDDARASVIDAIDRGEKPKAAIAKVTNANDWMKDIEEKLESLEKKVASLDRLCGLLHGVCDKHQAQLTGMQIGLIGGRVHSCLHSLKKISTMFKGGKQ